MGTKPESGRYKKAQGNWLARVSGVVIGAAVAAASLLVPALANAEQEASRSSSLERRIEAVREAADANVAEPAEQNHLQTVQWRNWPNWSDWPNWPNWANWGNWGNWPRY